MEGTTGQTDYKLSGTDNWVNISTCTGTFASPGDPPANGECSITDGTDTKILTFHFTEFAGLTETVVVETDTETDTDTDTETTTSSSSTSSSGGSGRTGVGPTSGPGSSSSRGGSIFSYDPPTIEGTTTKSLVPSWTHNVILWWTEDKITDQEFKNRVTYLLDQNIIHVDAIRPGTAMMDLAPSTKHLFALWSNDNLPESSIMGLFNYYRNMGVW